MLKPKQTLLYPYAITLPSPYQGKSPHKITPKVFRGDMNTCGDYYRNDPLGKQMKKPGNCPNDEKLKPAPKQLALDQCFVGSTNLNTTSNQPSLRQPPNRPLLKIPTNPFQQILNQSDTPDFNLSLPFADDFSKIDLKSPTFSDIFTISQIKSPQFKNQNTNFFITARKKPIEVRQDFNKTVKVRECYRRDEGEEKFLQKMDRCMKEMNVEKLQMTKQPKTVKNRTNWQDNIKKLSVGYKLKNHFNPSTPRLNKLPQNITTPTNNPRLKKCQILHNYISTQSNPQQQGKIINPIAITYPKSPKAYKFSENSITLTHKDHSNLKANKPKDQSVKQQPNQLIAYKMPVPRLELKAEMEEIYNGKFKIQQSGRQ